MKNALFRFVLLFYLFSAALAQSEKLERGWTERSIQIDGIERWYRIYTSPNILDEAPVVMLLHGGAQSMRDMFKPNRATRYWVDLADKHGFILLAPNGTNIRTGDTRGDKQAWNDLRSSHKKHEKADDVAFLSQLLDRTHQEFETEPRRVYITGASNGGMMTYRMLIEKPDYFAAGAAFIANLPSKNEVLQTPSQSVPILIMNGTEDKLVKWEGGRIRLGTGRRGEPLMSAEDTATWWARANGADLKNPIKENLPNVHPDDRAHIEKTIYPAKNNGAPVWFFKVEGGGHQMPSQKYSTPKNFLTKRLLGRQCKDAEGAQIAWQFMTQFSKNTTTPRAEGF